jgi:predicted SAM-dependent methyltransferase
MLGAFFRTIGRPKANAPSADAQITGPLRLHIGGKTRHPDWKVLNVVPGPNVDFVGNCTDLSQFAEASVSEIYASHVLEHLSHRNELSAALSGFLRVLVPGGVLRVSVPDMTALCALFNDPALTPQARYEVMRMMFGGQFDSSDFHRVGLSDEFLRTFLSKAGFANIERVEDLGGFDDTSRLVFEGRRISLNMIARKPGTTA